ncbi:IclR family transcriptional regulator [Solwaraspora sp. WMMA2080]|uniref:IclR family transcriptional regulator n=1 Tax=unclassified Solwaraspora TaxID=2627926 RepID=UPI00248B0A85|nr:MULTISPECIES: IclR family transcriptional regulator [unclassified Solwaraspora]WBB99961.1 IclR family transcriptional regulator [Solwaraspora sp. WMMA2059]WBC21492.1 IclR family transcriptional regulator [Solwaraspora sp. WMMA2080]
MQNAVPYPIESVDNALRLILLLRERSRLGVAEAARHLGVAPSTAHRLLGMLKHHGFAVQDGRRAYLPGPVFADLGLLAGRAGPDLRTVVRPHLERLSGELQETVHLAVLQGTAVRFLDGVEATHGLRVGSRAGMSMPAHCTSGGKVLLAQLSPAELEVLYPRGLPAVYGPAVEDLATLRRQLTTARRLGYAVNREESERGITGIGVCLRDTTGRVRGALAAGMPTARCPNIRIPEVAAALRTAAGLIAAELGGN